MVSAETGSKMMNARWPNQARRSRAKPALGVLAFRIDPVSGGWVGGGTTRGLSCCGGCSRSRFSHVLAAVARGGCLLRSRIRCRSRGCCGRWACLRKRPSWRRRGHRLVVSWGGSGRDWRARSRALGERASARGSLRGNGLAGGGHSGRNAWVHGLRACGLTAGSKGGIVGWSGSGGPDRCFYFLHARRASTSRMPRLARGVVAMGRIVSLRRWRVVLPCTSRGARSSDSTRA